MFSFLRKEGFYKDNIPKTNEQIKKDKDKRMNDKLKRIDMIFEEKEKEYKLENPKTTMKTKKITKRVLPEVHKDLDKYMKNFDLSIDKSLKPKKRLMRTMKIVEPKKTSMSTTKIIKPVKKRNFITTTKIVEYKPKEHELNKVIELLGELKQTSPIINAKKYVKNFIKNN